MKLRGKRIVIIGGSSGIGLAAAKAALKEGATLVIASRSEEKLDRAKKEIKGDVESIVLDMSREEEMKNFFSKIGEFDHLVTTGGVTLSGALHTADNAVVRSSFDNKFWGQYYAAKYGAPNILEKGSIVFFSGVLGLRPAPNTSIMAAVNGAIESLGRALAVELAPIRVNVIAPGYVETPRLANLIPEDLATIKEQIAQQVALGRPGTPEEIAETVLYLLQNDFTTGSTICNDGGYTLR